MSCRAGLLHAQRVVQEAAAGVVHPKRTDVGRVSLGSDSTDYLAPSRHHGRQRCMRNTVQLNAASVARQRASSHKGRAEQGRYELTRGSAQRPAPGARHPTPMHRYWPPGVAGAGSLHIFISLCARSHLCLGRLSRRRSRGLDRLCGCCVEGARDER
jgi:hypothetical protein